MFVVTKDDINSKTQFVAALKKFIHTGQTTVPQSNNREYHSSPGEMELLYAIVGYFETHD